MSSGLAARTAVVERPVAAAATPAVRGTAVRPRVVVLFRQMSIGGAERQLVEVARGLSRSYADLTLLSFYDGGELAGSAEAIAGLGRQSLSKQGRWEVGSFLLRAYRAIRDLRPDVVYGYQTGANELALVLGRLVGAKVVWGIRASNMDLTQYDWLWRMTARIGAWLSRFVDLIIVNSESGARYCASLGYPVDRMVVVSNGIDTGRFQIDRTAGAELRAAWQIPADTTLVGIVARLDRMKDHETFLRAAAIVHARRPDVRFVCVGDGAPDYRRSLEATAAALGLGEVVRWTGSELRVTGVMNALDVLCSSSAFGEGFSNVVGEAMACGTPCVVTDVGDSARVVGDTGIAVPPGTPEQLGAALLSVVEQSRAQRQALGQRARRRIDDHFSLEALYGNTQAALDRVARAV